MIMTKEFIDWFENASSDDQKSVYNFVISTSCSLRIIDRLKVAVEIILGQKFNKWISRNQ